jgi:SAM-dependent methyltransferase
VSLGVRFARLPRSLSRRLLPMLRYLNLMRALEFRLLAPWLRQVGGWRVLDVGCGHGLYSLDLARRGAVLVGCDLQRPALTDARQTALGLGLDGRALFLVADGAALPLPEGAFDLVICNCVLEHVADDGAALAAMARSLRRGGVLYLSVDNADHGLALGFLEGLPGGAKGWLLQPDVAAAPSVSAGLEARLDDLYAVLRRYHRDELIDSLSGLGLSILDSRPYLSGIGAAHYEAFHALRILDPSRGLGRLLYMLSSLLLYPLAARADSRQDARGHGLAVLARKEGKGGA